MPWDLVPPPWAVEAARLAAITSPCMKSKRGVAIYDADEADRILDGRALLDAERWGRKLDLDRAKDQSIIAARCNDLPPNWTCTGSEKCRQNCGKLCNHAEANAITEAGALTSLGNAAAVHVKVVAGQVVAGGPPSCWQCSRMVASSGLRGIWLYELGPTRCLACKRFEDSSEKLEERVKRCMECPNTELVRVDAWHWYAADMFHIITLANCKVTQ